MKKICFVVSSPTTANVFLKDHIENLSKYYEIDIIANFDKEHKEHKERKEHITRINASIDRKINLKSDLAALFYLIKLFKKNEYVSVHSVTPKAGLLAMTAAFITQIPNRIHWFTGQVWVTKKGINRKLLKFADKIINFLSTSNLVDSQSQYKFLLKNKVINNKSSVIANGSICGFDKNRFYPDSQARVATRSKLSINDNEFVILYLGRMVEDKGIFDLVQSLLLIEDNLNICLLLIGSDEEGNIDKLKNKLVNSKVKFIYIPFVNDPEKYLKAADLYCMPSYREGFGLSVIEAAACAIPTIAYDIYGISDAVSEETGVLVQVGIIADLSRAIYFLLTNPEKRKIMGQKALKRAEELFSKELVVNGLNDFYLREVGYTSSKTKSRILNISAASLTIKRFVEPFETDLSNSGFDSIYAVGRGGDENFPNNYINLPLERGPYFFKSWLKYHEMRSIIFKVNPNIIIFHTPLSVFAFLPILKTLNRHGFKLIYIARGSLDESISLPARLLWYFFDPTIWSVWNSVGVINDYLYDKCLGKNMKVKLLSLGGAPLNITHNESDWLSNEELQIGWVGRLDKDKRITDFIEVVKILKERHLLNVKGNVVGASIPGDKPEIISNLPFITFHGWQNNPWRIIGNCDLLISTSIREGYGLVPVEAGYYGIPTIAYSNHGTSKSVREIGGVLVGKLDVDGLVNQVLKWNARSTTEKIELRKQTKQRVNDLINNSNQTQDLLDLIKLAGKS
jgi:glycosyltransferase involved in cell wall biosynthesis